MSRIYHTHLLDLDRFGLLAITLEDAFSPVLADTGGDAVWIDDAGVYHARRNLFLKAINRDVALAEVERGQAERAGAVPSVRHYWQWLHARVSAGQLSCLPVSVFALTEGRVLAIYQSCGLHNEIRLLNVRDDKELWSMDESQLRVACGITRQPAWATAGLMRLMHVAAAGRDRLLIHWGGQGYWLHPTTLGFQVKPSPAVEATNAATWTIVREDTSNKQACFRLMHADGRSVAFQSEPSGWIYRFEGALDRDRVVFSHEGGLIEILDIETSARVVLRPFVDARRDEQVDCQIAADGGHVLVSTWKARAIIDIDHRRIAMLRAPAHVTHADASTSQTEFRPCTFLRGERVWRTDGETIDSIALSELKWQGLPERISRAAGKVSATSIGSRLATDLRRPVLGFMPAKGASTSYCGDLDRLPADIERPQYEGLPMAMVCQIDLTAHAVLLAGTGFPNHGVLLVFVAVNEDGEVMEEIEFAKPDFVCVRVSHAPPVACPLPPRKRESATFPLHAERHEDWPEIDSIWTAGRLPTADDGEVYRNAVQRVGAGDQPFRIRLGGYPLALQSNDLEIEAERLARLQDDRVTEASDWRLLLQIESDVFMWGTDSGCLYLMIHRDDLVAERFDRIIWIAQGY